jgi:hypothetical protein
MKDIREEEKQKPILSKKLASSGCPGINFGLIHLSPPHA